MEYGRGGNLVDPHPLVILQVVDAAGNPLPGITVAGDVVIDTSWNLIYYRGNDSRMYAVQWTGSQWAHVLLSASANVKGNLAVDATSHLICYQGTNNFVWCEQWTGSVWQQVQLGTTTANVGGSLAVDYKGLLVYYRSWTDNGGWATYWNGSQWTQVQLDAGANMIATPGLASGIAPYPLKYDTLYLDGSGQCKALYWGGSSWGHVVLGDGGEGLTGGLSLQSTVHWAFARRNDGNVVVFYYQ